jgi:WD40 repeat protein/tRNA A-37 threonylcarbamoyl transferase component Bud32
MPESRTCPNGHTWETVHEGPLEGAPLCPVCDSVARDAVPPPPRQAQPPPGPARPNLPGYEIVEELGRGGMGVVYRARHEKLGREVALKMIRRGPQERMELLDNVLARFTVEARAVARLQHPNIVQIFEVGDYDGLPYLALELVEGGNLARQLAGQPQPSERAARLLEVLARAVDAAHKADIVHRDLRPENVLLTADGTPKITDFGLAKILGGPAPATPTGQTTQGALLGTPCYMAPEQAQGQPVGPPADVYSLGAILYEALTGRPPFLAETALDTVVQAIEKDPVPPARLNHKVKADLEAICLKCLEKLPGQRYPSARDLADDLGRFQRGEPTRARPPSALRRGRMWARRRPGPAATLAVSALALLGLLVAGALFTFHLQRALGLTEKARKDADANARAEAGARARIGQALAGSRVGQAHAAWRENKIELADKLLAGCPPETRLWEWHYVRRLLRDGHFTFHGHRLGVTCVAFSPDGARLASGSGGADSPNRPGELVLWDAHAGRALRPLRGHRTGVRCLAFSPDGARLASGGGGRPGDGAGELFLWDVRGGRRLRAFQGFLGPVEAVAFSPDGAWLASAGPDGTVRLWGAHDGRLLRSLVGPHRKPSGTAHHGPVTALAFAPDGKSLASAGRDGLLKVWDMPAGRLLWGHQAHADALTGLAFAPDGKSLASAAGGQTVKLWDARGGRQVGTLPAGGTSRVGRIAFSPDGRSLAAASEDHMIRLWDVRTGLVRRSLRGHTAEVSGLSFSADGQRLTSGSHDRTVRAWDVRGGGAVRIDLKDRFEGLVALSPDGESLGVGSRDGKVTVWAARTGALLFSVWAHHCEVQQLCFSADGQRLASAGHQDEKVKVWSVGTGRPLQVLDGPMKPLSLCLSPDGTRLAVSGLACPARVFRVSDGRPLAELHDTRDGASGLTFSPDGRRLAGLTFRPAGRPVPRGESAESVRCWDADTGQELPKLQGHRDQVTCLAFSRDGQALASASQDGEVKVWAVSTGAERLSLAGHAHAVRRLAFSPDGRRLVSAEPLKARAPEEYELKVWDLDTGHELLTLPRQREDVRGLAFSADGHRVVAAGHVGGEGLLVRAWDARPGRPDVVLRGHSLPVELLALSPGGGAGGAPPLLASCGQRLASDGPAELKVWDLRANRELHSFTVEEGGVQHLALSRDGRVLAAGAREPAGRRYRIKAWDLTTGRPRPALSLAASPDALELTPDGRKLNVWGADGMTTWDLGEGVPAGRARRGQPGYVDPLPDGPGRYAAYARGTAIRVVDAHPGAEERAWLRGLARLDTGWHARAAASAVGVLGGAGSGPLGALPGLAAPVP